MRVGCATMHVLSRLIVAMGGLLCGGEVTMKSSREHIEQVIRISVFRPARRLPMAVVVLLLCLLVGGCGKSSKAAPAVTPSVTVKSMARTQPAGADVALFVAKTFMVSLLTKGSTEWRGVTALPMAWDQRCALLTDWADVSSKVVSQRPPPGVVQLQQVRWAKRPADADEDAMADAWRMLSDVHTSCGSPNLDATQAKLSGLVHVLVHVSLATKAGTHPLLLRLSGLKGTWRVTGLRSR